MRRRIECFSLDREEQLRFRVELHGDAHQRQLPGSGGDSLGDLVLDHREHPGWLLILFFEELAKDRGGDCVGQVADQSVRGSGGDQGERFGGIGVEDVLLDHHCRAFDTIGGQSPAGAEGHRLIELYRDQGPIEVGQTSGQ